MCEVTLKDVITTEQAAAKASAILAHFATCVTLVDGQDDRLHFAEQTIDELKLAMREAHELARKTLMVFLRTTTSQRSALVEKSLRDLVIMLSEEP